MVIYTLNLVPLWKPITQKCKYQALGHTYNNIYSSVVHGSQNKNKTTL